MDFAGIVFGIIFSAAGLLFAAGKLHPYLAAWKNMTPEEQDEVDIVPLCRNVGELIFLNGVIFLLNGFWPPFRDHWFAAAMIAWMFAAGLDVYFIGKNDKYRKHREEETRQDRKTV